MSQDHDIPSDTSEPELPEATAQHPAIDEAEDALISKGFSVPHHALDLPKDQRMYKVFRNDHEYVNVQAVAAFEAIEKSNIEQPTRVILSKDYQCILSEDILKHEGFYAFVLPNTQDNGDANPHADSDDEAKPTNETDTDPKT